MIYVLVVVSALAGTVGLLLAESHQGVRAVGRTRLGHGLLGAALVASILALRQGVSSLRWGLLVLSGSTYLVYLWYLLVVTRLPQAKGLRPGQRLGGGLWRKADSKALVPVASIWPGGPSLLVLYRGPW